MKQIDKLLIRARDAANKNDERLFMAFVYPEDDAWIARGHLWRGMKGKGFRAVYEPCSTMEDAVDAAHRMADQYPPTQDFTIIVDDLAPDE